MGCLKQQSFWKTAMGKHHISQDFRWNYRNICEEKHRKTLYFIRFSFKLQETDQELHQEMPKMRKWIPRWAKMSQMVPKEGHLEPKGRPRGAKGSKRGQRTPKGNQKGANGRPKCIQESILGKGREKGGKGAVPTPDFQLFWEPFFIKSRFHLNLLVFDQSVLVFY